MTPAAKSANLAEVLKTGGQSFSFELFPPKTDDGERALWQTVRDLELLNPTFVSVTYGAGGSTRDRTVRITEEIAEQTSLMPVGHLTCVGSSRDEIAEVISEYATAGVRTILALRGDPPGGPTAPWVSHAAGIEHADELVALIKSLGDFTVGVAAFPDGHPSSLDHESDARVLAAKQDAGAEFAITQFFFRTRDYFDLVERARAHGCTIPIIPGLMPVTNVAQISRFAELSGAAFPSDLLGRFEMIKDDDEAVRELGVEIATEMSDELLSQGAPGLHFYTLNRSTSTARVYESLGLGFR